MSSQVAGWSSNWVDAVEPPRVTSERRRRRSGDLERALRLQLESVRGRLGLDALVLCDDLGEILALAGDAAIVDRAAEQAPWLAATPIRNLEDALAYFWDVLPGLCSAEVAVETIPGLGGMVPLILVGIGPSRYLEEWVEYAARGVSRILATLS